MCGTTCDQTKFNTLFIRYQGLKFVVGNQFSSTLFLVHTNHKMYIISKDLLILFIIAASFEIGE